MPRYTKAARERRASYTRVRCTDDAQRLGSLVGFTRDAMRKHVALGYNAAQVQIAAARAEMAREDGDHIGEIVEFEI
jgi:hypothetical protein